MNAHNEQSVRHMLPPDEYVRRIGILMRDGRPIYYAIFGKAMIESYSREEICMQLDKYAHKLPEWDRNRR